MGEERLGLPQGTLDLLILKALALDRSTGGRYRTPPTDFGTGTRSGRGRLPSLHCLERSADQGGLADHRKQSPRQL
jgi:hypothetical protein